MLLRRHRTEIKEVEVAKAFKEIKKVVEEVKKGKK